MELLDLQKDAKTLGTILLGWRKQSCDTLESDLTDT